MRVLVAGADGGIGSACVEALRGERRRRRRPARCDVTAPGGAEQAVRQAVEELGGLDGIVHAVGMSGRRLGDGPVTEATDEAWSEVVRVNLESVFRLLRAGLPALREAGGGSFVVVGSALAESADRDFLTAAYAASKAGILGLVRTAALEAAPWNVRVNAVAAGLVDTPMAAARRRGRADRPSGSPSSSRWAARMLAPGGGRATPSPGSCARPATTGASIPVDGGWSLR